MTLGGGGPSAYWLVGFRFPFKKELRPADSRRRPREWSGGAATGLWSGVAGRRLDCGVEWRGGGGAGRLYIIYYNIIQYIIQYTIQYIIQYIMQYIMHGKLGIYMVYG